MKSRKHVVIGLALAALTTAGIAYATIPDANGVYTACRLNITGTIRLIDPSLGAGSLARPLRHRRDSDHLEPRRPDRRAQPEQGPDR